MKRRTFLHSAAVGSGIALAGCLGSDGDPVQIASIEISNSNGQAHTVGLTVEFEGDTIVEETYELEDGAEAGPIEGELPDEEGEYEITVDPDGIESETFEPGEQTGADCVSIRYELLQGDVLQSSEDC